MDRHDAGRKVRCSFCGHRQDQVKKLVAGTGVYICDLCIALCQEVLDDDARSSPPWKGGSVARTSGRASLRLRLREGLRHFLHPAAPGLACASG